MQNLPSSPIFTANHADLAKFMLFLITFLFLLLDIRKTGSNTLLVQITRISQPYVGIHEMFTFVYISKSIVLITCINLLQSKHHLSSESRITNVHQH